MATPLSTRWFVFLLSFPLLFSEAFAQSNDELLIYTPSALGSVSASESCVQALTANVTCYPNLGAAVLQTSMWSPTALDLICTDACTDSLKDYIALVDKSCGSDALYNISGTPQRADSAGQEMLWKQIATCLRDPDSGKYCNLVLQGEEGGGVQDTNLTCQDCTLDYLTTLANSKWGRQIISPDAVSSQISSCSITGYSVTYTPSTATSEASSKPNPSPTNARCDVSNPDIETYTSENNQTCVEISKAMNVSTPALTSKNALDRGCKSLTGGMALCLPLVCDIYLVQPNDTCASIIGGLFRQVSPTLFRSWNPGINSACSNLDAFMGEYICISPPGSLTIPDEYPLTPATTAAPVPSNAVTTSKERCGTWYTIRKGDTCAIVADKFGLSLSDLLFLNPQLDKNCTSLWLDNSYCVQAVGNINTYSGYSGTTAWGLPTLASTINVNATRSVNRTTSYLFGYTPQLSTTTVTFDTDAYKKTQNYTLCWDAIKYYNLTDENIYAEVDQTNSAWWSEYDRVCVLDLNSPLPTSAFNTSIVLNTPSDVPPTRTASTGALSTISSASATSTPTRTISPNGLCGGTNGWTCKGSQFGDCCSKSGYCGSSDAYCGAACDPNYGRCNDSSSTKPISPNGLCGGDKGYTCKGSQFGECCSKYGYCGTGKDYCITNCDPNYGLCN